MSALTEDEWRTCWDAVVGDGATAKRLRGAVERIKADADTNGFHRGVRKLDALRREQAAALASDKAAQGDALRAAARRFVGDMADAWGGDSQWLTTGTRVAEVVACTLREWAADMESECSHDSQVATCEWCGQHDGHTNGCRLGRGPDEGECSHDWIDRPESDTRECLICGVEATG